MAKIHPFIVVLWGPNFDVIAASIFTVELRKAGHKTKIIQLKTQGQAVGEYGCCLLPDLLLPKALSMADKITTVIWPFDHWQKAKPERHLEQFLPKAIQAQYIVPTEPELSCQLTPKNVITYPEKAELITFAQTLAGRL